jgi:N-acetyl-anhydromuramyl-L-alanine amidase AmpD
MLDVDGTIYQTLDVKERAWHATKANSRSVGIEIANVGAFEVNDNGALDAWYREHSVHSSRTEAIVGQIQGQLVRMYDLAEPQYEALIKLTAALCRALPRINCDYPRDPSGRLIDHVLSEQQFQSHHGLVGHYHVQLDKIDPGPAFQWDRVISNARKLL